MLTFEKWGVAGLGSIPATDNAILLLGRNDMGDQGGGYFKRYGPSTSPAPASGAFFMGPIYLLDPIWN